MVAIRVNIGVDIRIGIEAHEAVEPWYDLFIQKLRAYRSRRDTCCRIMLSTRIRAPIDHYLSFFRWGIEKRYPGKTLDWWAPDNLQSTLLLRGNAGMNGQWIDGRKYEGRRRWYEREGGRREHVSHWGSIGRRGRSCGHEWWRRRLR